MARYQINVLVAETTSIVTGIEFSSAQAAQGYALELLGRLMNDAPYGGRRRQTWKVDVFGEAGALVLQLKGSIEGYSADPLGDWLKENRRSASA